MGGMPNIDPAELERLSKQMGGAGGMPGALPKGIPGLPGGLPGLGGGRLPGLGGGGGLPPYPGKKK